MTQVVIQEQQRGLVKPGLIPSVSLALAGLGAALSPIFMQLDFETTKQTKDVKGAAFFAFDNQKV